MGVGHGGVDDGGLGDSQQPDFYDGWDCVGGDFAVVVGVGGVDQEQ